MGPRRSRPVVLASSVSVSRAATGEHKHIFQVGPVVPSGEDAEHQVPNERGDLYPEPGDVQAPEDHQADRPREPPGDAILGDVPEDGQLKGVDGVLHRGSDEDDLHIGQNRPDLPGQLHPVLPGISMSNRISSKKRPSSVMS